MKTVLTALLCFALVNGAFAQTNICGALISASDLTNANYRAQCVKVEPAPPRPCGPLADCIALSIMGGAFAFSFWYAVKVLFQGPPDYQYYDVYLLQSYDRGCHWQTNNVYYAINLSRAQLTFYEEYSKYDTRGRMFKALAVPVKP